LQLLLVNIIIVIVIIISLNYNKVQMYYTGRKGHTSKPLETRLSKVISHSLFSSFIDVSLSEFSGENLLELKLLDKLMS